MVCQSRYYKKRPIGLFSYLFLPYNSICYDKLDFKTVITGRTPRGCTEAASIVYKSPLKLTHHNLEEELKTDEVVQYP